MWFVATYWSWDVDQKEIIMMLEIAIASIESMETSTSIMSKSFPLKKIWELTLMMVMSN